MVMDNNILYRVKQNAFEEKVCKARRRKSSLEALRFHTKY